jgi:leader peptidase (prepilin peptidase)/N-methyltransferase
MAELFYASLAAAAMFLKTHPLYAWAGVALIGLLTGNFLTVLFENLSQGKKAFLFSRRECPHCGHRFKRRQILGLPTPSLLAGRCPACRADLGAGPLLLHLLGPALVCLLYYFYGPSIRFAAYGWLFLSLLAVSAIDMKDHTVPCEITLKGTAFGLLCCALFPELMRSEIPLYALAQSALGFLTGVLLLGTVRFFGDLIFRQELLGFGDVALMGMIGCFLGVQLTFLCVLLSPFLALPVFLVLWRARRTHVISFSPVVSLAAILSVSFGDTIILNVKRIFFI